MTRTKWEFRMDQKFMRNVELGVEAVGKQQGAIVRKFARDSMRKAPKRGASKPGTPPRWRTKALKNFVLFAWDNRTQSVVVGSKKLNKPLWGQPLTLESGGNSPAYKDPVEKTRTVVRIAPRPYMKPALDRAVGKFPQMYENELTKKRV